MKQRKRIALSWIMTGALTLSLFAGMTGTAAAGVDDASVGGAAARAEVAQLMEDEAGAEAVYVYGDGNQDAVHEITAGGTYYIGDSATGILTVDTTDQVTLIGNGADDDQLFQNLFINCAQAGTKLALQDVGISDKTNTANLINFTGRDNVLTILGTCLMDYDVGYTSQNDALIHVPFEGSLTINGSGTFYQYNCTQGAGIGGNTREMNGDITFALTGSAFIKGTRQGAVIGAGANAGSSGDAPGSITFESGTYNLETNSRGAAIGGSAGSGGASSGTSVYVRGGNININCDFTGSAVGGGGYNAGNDASGGTLYITGGSLRTYIDKNAANNSSSGYNGAPFTEGINDAAITAQRVNASGETVYKCVFDTTDLGEGPYTVLVDGQPFYTGGRHEYAFINEALSKDSGEQISVTRTMDNWIDNDEPNLYFYLTGEDHTITVNGADYKAVFDTAVLDEEGKVTDNKVYTTGAFTVEAPAEYEASFGMPSAETISVGQTVTVPVILTGANPAAGAELHLSSDVTVAKITGITLPDELAENGMQTISEDGASAMFSFYGEELDVASGVVVAEVTLEAVAEGTTALSLTNGTAARGAMTKEWAVAVPEEAVSVSVRGETSVPAFRSHSLLLSGQIGVNFYMDLPELDGVDYADSYMDFTVCTDTQTAAYDAEKTNSSGTYYGFTCYINSVQMADTITAVFHYGDGQTVRETYSVAEYVKTFQTYASSFDENTQNLINALADYGHYIQPFLANVRNWTIGADHAAMDGVTEYTDADVEAAAEAVKDYNVVHESNGSGVEQVTFSLYLDTDTSIYFYVKPASDFSGEVTAAIDGGSDNAAEAMEDGRYRIAVPGIAAHLLGTDYTVNVSAGSDFTITASAMAYVNSVLHSGAYAEDADALYAMTALYRYYAAAAAYKGI